VRTRLAFAALIIVSLVRVAATHRVFSATADEPVHIAAGYDWLTTGTYLLDPEHPPLARALFGLGLRAGGVVLPPPSEWHSLQTIWQASMRGTELLWSNGAYIRNLARARLGNLVFFFAALLGVAALARRAFGDGVALLAVALFGSLPPVLAHAGLATTDMAVTATVPLAILALKRWLEQPSLGRAIVLGVAIGAGLATKMSFIPFFGVAAIVVFVVQRRRIRIVQLLLAAAIAMLSVWSVYRFEFGTMAQVSPALRSTIGANVPIPAPTYFAGLVYVKVHAERGHNNFLLGRHSDRGWWYYFPLAILFKTPLALLILFGAGVYRSRDKEPRELVLIAAAMLAVVLPSTLNIGVRHILVIYPFVAIIAAYGAAEMWQDMPKKAIVVALLASFFIGTTLAHPDYLAWFNELAGRHPENVLNDSNLDWGQDVLRLAKVAREEKIGSLSILIFGSNDLDRLGLPPHQTLQPRVPVQGWIAVSETALCFAAPGDYDWLTSRKPVRHVGKSIRLYFWSAAARPPL